MLRVSVLISNLAFITSLQWPNAKDLEDLGFLKHLSDRSAVASGANASGCRKELLPSLLFIGTGHAGTTSLALLMDSKHKLRFGDRKEHHFFHCSPDMQCAEDVEQYMSEFGVGCDTIHTFDASQDYLDLALEINAEDAANVKTHKPGLPAVEYVHSVLPDAKILIMIRDPVDTIFSEGIDDVDVMISWEVVKNLADAIEIWMQVFDPSRFLFIRAEEAFKDMPAAANQVYQFMGLENETYSSDEISDLENSGRRRSSRRASSELRRKYYASPGVMDSKYKLERLTGMTFDWEESQ